MRLIALLCFIILCSSGLWYLSRGQESVNAHFPAVVHPQGNPPSVDEYELGRHLFYDRRLSFNQSISCADCHQQARAFSDSERFSSGINGELTRRNAMSLTNVAYNARFTWADDGLRSLEEQARIPLTRTHPVEMGFNIDSDVVISRLANEPYYRSAFSRVFAEKQPISLDNIVAAIASFERTLISANSAYDQYLQGEAKNFSPAARRGLELFYSTRLGCIKCHGGYNFRFALNFRSSPEDDSVAMHNNGLYNIDGLGAYPPSDRGLMDISGDARHMGHFKTPTLRNIAVTAPYMHDGSIASLAEVIDHYTRGGRKIDSGPYRGDGSRSPLKSPLVTGFSVTELEKSDLIAFLEALTDEQFLTDPGLSNPWQRVLTDPAPL
jgi:cytochrome c peroxidase